VAINQPIMVGFMGSAGQGKSTLGIKLCDAAGVGTEVMRETSDHIYQLTRLICMWLESQRHGHDLEDLRSVKQALAQIPVWFEDAGCNIFGIPPDVFDPGQISSNSDDVALLAKAMRDFQVNPDPYRDEITVDNKSLFRPLMTALQGIVSSQVVPWLRSHDHPTATNIWPVIAMEELRQLHQEKPGLPLLICSGLRLPGDDNEIRGSSGYLLERRRFDVVDPSSAGLKTEVVHLDADYVVTGDCTLEELSSFAQWLWAQLSKHQGLVAGGAQRIPLHIERILATV
jgi:hypothetical protein